ncbi:MAG: DUF3099 domain-containing protein [Bowdeniella nasicola]|nr:DUF3099 domain-containing protein [Bowdeniella nasicola]
MGTKAQQVFSITSARRALSEDVDDRNIRYLVSMAIRTACVLGAALVSGYWRWIFVFGAVFLPILAVMVANAGREPAGQIDELADAAPPTQLPAAAGPVVTPDGDIVQDVCSPTHLGERDWFHDDTEFLR